MFFHIKHVTRFAYSAPVFCEPLTVRLRPRCDAAQRLARYAVRTDPQPAGSAEIVEADGHTALCVWFNALTCDLAIAATSLVETLRANPFDYLVEPSALRLPFEYAPELAATLAPYRVPCDAAPELAALSADVQTAAAADTLEFLRLLNARLHESIERERRPIGLVFPASETLARGRGACRDLAALFVELCRHAGLAARFVSGYEAGGDDDGQHALHAWAEVYVPGGGWRGYDPSVGLAVADRHVALAAGRLPAAAAATAGTFRSSTARSRLETQVIVRTFDEPPPEAREASELRGDAPARLQPPTAVVAPR